MADIRDALAGMSTNVAQQGTLDDLLSKQPVQGPATGGGPQTPGQSSVQDLFAQGNVQSSQPIPQGGQGSTEGVPRQSTNLDLLSPEYYRNARKGSYEDILASPMGTPEQRAGLTTVLGSMQAEDTARRREELERTQYERQQTAATEAFKAQSPTRIAEAKAGEVEKRESARLAIQQEAEARLNLAMRTPIQVGPFAGRKPIDFETPQGQQMLNDYLNMNFTKEELSNLTSFLSGYGQVSKMFPEGLGADAEQHRSFIALLLSHMNARLTGRPSRSFLKGGPNGVDLNYADTLGQMAPPGLTPGGQPTIGPKRPFMQRLGTGLRKETFGAANQIVNAPYEFGKGVLFGE